MFSIIKKWWQDRQWHYLGSTILIATYRKKHPIYCNISAYKTNKDDRKIVFSNYDAPWESCDFYCGVIKPWLNGENYKWWD